MTHTIKLTQIGKALGVVLPNDVLAQLNVTKGDSLHLTETPQGFQLTPYDPELEEQLDVGRKFMREYRDTFHALAK